MSLIPFPHLVKPLRLTPKLVRSDEIFQSPVTGIQQSVARGASYWSWKVEYRDLSDSERDIVQAFLHDCKGALNHFKIPDFGNYEISGAASDWTDVFSDNGYFRNQADLDAFTLSAGMDYSLNDNSVLIERRLNGTVTTMRKDNVTSVDVGGMYAARCKFFSDDLMSAALHAGNLYDQAAGPTRTTSTGQLTLPIFTDVGSLVGVGIWQGEGRPNIGNQFVFADFTLSRVLVVSNSENLFTRSNNFTHADWDIGGAANVESGFGDEPYGTVNGDWKLYGDAVDSQFWIRQAITKTNTPDLYTAFIEAKADELSEMRLAIFDNTGANYALATFWLSSGTTTGVQNGGSFTRENAKIFDIGSGWYKCCVTALVNSDAAVRMLAYLGSGTAVDFTNNGSDGIRIANAQIRKHPFPGHYVPTTDTAIVGTGWQTGSKLYVEGFDTNEVALKKGTRLEVINRYHSTTEYERSEFKRLTKTIKSHREGWGVLEFDPPIRNAPESLAYDNSLGGHVPVTLHPIVIVHKPELTARLLGSTIQYVEKPLRFTDISFDIIEDLTE